MAQRREKLKLVNEQLWEKIMAFIRSFHNYLPLMFSRHFSFKAGQTIKDEIHKIKSSDFAVYVLL
jgi:hypothetical protein